MRAARECWNPERDAPSYTRPATPQPHARATKLETVAWRVRVVCVRPRKVPSRRLGLRAGAGPGRAPPRPRPHDHETPEAQMVPLHHTPQSPRDGAEPERGAFRGPIGVPCVTPPSRRPSAAEPSARGSGREKKLRGAGGAAVGRVPRPRLRSSDAGAMRLVDAGAGASRRRTCPMRAHFHGATTKRRSRCRARH